MKDDRGKKTTLKTDTERIFLRLTSFASPTKPNPTQPLCARNLTMRICWYNTVGTSRVFSRFVNNNCADNKKDHLSMSSGNEGDDETRHEETIAVSFSATR